MKLWTSLAGAAAVVLAAASAHAQIDSIKLGTEGAYPPYNYYDASGQLIGFEIDLGNELCRRMEVECEWVAQDWDGIIPALLNGRYDAIIAGMSRTDERREQIAFSNAYTVTPAWFVASAESDLAGLETLEETMAALEGKTIGVQTATIHENFLREELGDGVDIRVYDTQDNLNLDLVAGRLDAGLADATSWQAFLDTEDGAGFAHFGPGLTGADFPVFGEGVGVGLRQGDTELMAMFNDAICSMIEDGTLAAMTTEWFGVDTSTPCEQ
ncbi:MAG: transporter substrate-binding domain-containing protein [Rhodospirillaceae bacterium]|nr:transporter substrate-binding domain-containing protein [Rhodospirillaceae bacterium]